ncbi:MAG: EVE domain-containing protein [candidate division WOR-3 bacterium]|nr:EVE domain-containing protein [candidate division WOR-3 bacterium]
MRYWCISTSARNWEICRKYKIWGMDGRYFVTFKKFLRADDQAVVYTHGGRFVAVVQFIGNYFYDERDLGWKKGDESVLFPYRINFKILYESNDPPRISFSTEIIENQARWDNERSNLIDDITFIADKSRTWNQYLQVSIIRITEEDFNIISQAIRRS